MIKKILSILLITVLTLAGCSGSDYTEPEDRTVVTMLIIEKNEEFVLTTEIIVLPKTKGDGGEAKFISADSNDISEAYKLLGDEVYNELSFYHCPVIVCDKNLFATEKEKIFEFILTNEQFSLSANLLICENINNLLKIAVKKGSYLGYEISEYISYKGIESKIIDIFNNQVNAAEISAINETEFEIKVQLNANG